MTTSLSAVVLLDWFLQTDLARIQPSPSCASKLGHCRLPRKPYAGVSLTFHSDNDEPNVAYPFNLFTEVGGAYDWNIGTIPQSQLNGNSRPLPAGHVVGGGSIINGMVWNRGEQDDFDAWVSFGNSGWGWNDLLPYFKRVEAANLLRERLWLIFTSLKPTPAKNIPARQSSRSRLIHLSMDLTDLSKSAIQITTGRSLVRENTAHLNIMLKLHRQLVCSNEPARNSNN
jgi:GMC oxidoreductase